MTAPEQCRPIFEKLSIRSGLTFNDEKIIVPTELREKLMETLHFGHAGSTKTLTEGWMFWWPNIHKKIEDQTNNRVACMTSGKTINSQIPKNETGKIKTLNEPGKKYKLISPGN